MRKEIVDYMMRVCTKYNLPLSMHYYPPSGLQKHDIYAVTLKGKAVVNFTSVNFYDISKSFRDKHFLPLIKIGMNHNLGEQSMKDQVHNPRAQGIYLIRDGVQRYLYGS